MFGLVSAVFGCKFLRTISAQVGDGSNTNRNTPVTVFGSGVVSVALGAVRWILTCFWLNLCIFQGKKASVVACLDIHLPTFHCCRKNDLLMNCSVCCLLIHTGQALTQCLQHHSCAVLTGGALKCWGFNDQGQVLAFELLVFGFFDVFAKAFG